MSVLLSILFFVVVFPLLGWSFLQLLKFKLVSEYSFEKYLLLLGVGLGIFPLLVVSLNLVHMPLYWWLILILALIVPILNLRYLKFNLGSIFKGFKDFHFLLMLVIFIVLFAVMLKGAFVYPYLEDDDSWAHALSAKYVAVERDIKVEKDILHYLNPYPPAYPALMGILHQLNDSIYWTLKFFNALIVALTIPFFYLFAQILFKSKNKALFSTFVLASLPSFLSHFIWTHSLAMLFIIIALYWMFRVLEDDKAFFLLPILISAIPLTQFTKTIKFGIPFLAFFVIVCILKKRFDYKIFLAGLFGILVSLIWWGSRFYGLYVKSQASAVAKGKGSIFAANIGTASTQAYYTLSTFLFPKGAGLITNPTGIGLIISILAVVGIIFILWKLLCYKKLDFSEKVGYSFILFFFFFTFLGVNSVTFHLPVGLFAFRFWMMLSIPVAVLSAFGLWGILSFCKKLRLSKFIPFIVIFILLGVIITSAYPKYSINTSFWPPMYSPIFPPQIIAEELSYFAQLRETPEQRFFPLCKDGFKKLIGNDQIVCAWCKGELEFRKQIFNKTAAEIHSFLQSYDYKGVIPDLSCLEDHSEEQLNTQLNKLLNSGLFKLNNNLNRLIILEVI